MKVSPTSYSLESAKAAIDYIVKHKTVYKNNVAKRTGAYICAAFCCSPCYLWSCFARIICCPVQCIVSKNTRCNPLTSLLTDSDATIGSDTCLSECCDAIDEKTQIKLVVPEDDIKQIIVYASQRIQDQEDAKVKYMISDAITPIVKSYKYTVDVTPQTVISYAISIMSASDSAI